MTQTLSVYFLPSDFESPQLAGGIAVIVDILRASTTITHGLANGADKIIPCGTVEQAREVKAADVSGNTLLGGERGGVKIDGFDLSNSPADYSTDRVQNKTIGFTTTNGTNALLKAAQAERRVIGAFVNLSAVAELILQCDQPVHIVCAGTNGHVTGEDVLFAGALTDRLLSGRPSIHASDAATIAQHYWLRKCADATSESVEAALLTAQGGRNLSQLGFQADIRIAAAIDELAVVGQVGSNGAIRSG